MTRWKHLRHLTLAFPDDYEMGWSVVAELPQLETFASDGGRLAPFQVAELQRLENLTSVALHRPSLTDACLEPLATMTQLRNVRLRANWLTEQAVSRLRAELPDAEISLAKHADPAIIRLIYGTEFRLRAGLLETKR